MDNTVEWANSKLRTQAQPKTHSYIFKTCRPKPYNGKSCWPMLENTQTIGGCSPVSQFLSGLKLEGDLFPRKHLSPLAHVVRVVCAGALHVRDGVHATAVRQRHPVFTPRKHTATVTVSKRCMAISYGRHSNLKAKTLMDSDENGNACRETREPKLIVIAVRSLQGVSFWAFSREGVLEGSVVYTEPHSKFWGFLCCSSYYKCCLLH